MPTEVVAAPITTQVIPQGMAITLFDWSPILGVPFWIFIDCFLLFCLAAVFVYWFARIRKLSAVSGWAESMKHADVNDVQVWIITRTQKLIIDCLKIEDNILSYHDKGKIGMWHHNTRESVIRVGGNPAVVVSEDFDQTRDIISEIALTDNCDEFNQDQLALQKALTDEYEEKKAQGIECEEPRTASPIEDYADYEEHGRENLQVIHPTGLPMRSFNIFSNIRFLKYFPKGCSHMFLGADVTLESRLLSVRPKTSGFWAKFAFPIIAAIVVLIITAAVWFMPL
jgi:hypothetical protein